MGDIGLRSHEWPFARVWLLWAILVLVTVGGSFGYLEAYAIRHGLPTLTRTFRHVVWFSWWRLLVAFPVGVLVWHLGMQREGMANWTWRDAVAGAAAMLLAQLLGTWAMGSRQ